MTLTHMLRYECLGCKCRLTHWERQCPNPDCKKYNQIVECPIHKPTTPNFSTNTAQTLQLVQAGGPLSLSEVNDLEDSERLCCGIPEVDRVLGGGLVPGSSVLLGGEPGVGKSTLLCQMLEGLASTYESALYTSGEETNVQIALRAKRIGVTAPGLMLYAETSLSKILSQAEEIEPAVLVVDSIQTVRSDELDSLPGSVTQIRECTRLLIEYSKDSGVPIILIGHVIKDGSVAGPKTLEHMVDTVLYFEGDDTSPCRILRSNKNRFGSTQEIGVFEMLKSGLQEVSNPSELFLAERPKGAPGSVVVASLEGTRPILIELQCLTAIPIGKTPHRNCIGVSSNRVGMLLTVLSERIGLNVSSQDVFVNIAGGLSVSEPALDLGIICSMISTASSKPIDSNTVVFGEVGLVGEVRAVNMPDLRLAEASKLGFKRCILPEKNRQRVGEDYGLELIGVKDLKEVIEALIL